MTTTNALRRSVIGLYKELQYMGRDYPAGAEYFQMRCKQAFLKNAHVRDPEQIEMLLERGKFVQREIEALYRLRKYRAMRARYYDKDELERQNRRIEEYLKEL